MDQKDNISKIKQWLIWIICGVAFVGGLVWLVKAQPKTPESETISLSGFHWHPELVIYIKGEKQVIPENIGLGAVHQPMHTHDDLPKIHLEFQGVVKKSDIVLGQFFKNWNKDMRSFGTNLKMIVNGKENTEYENYAIQDGDKIEIWFE